MGVLQSSLLQGFLPHLMLSVIHVQIRHRPRDASNDLAFEVAFQAAQSDALQVGIAFKGFTLSIVNELQRLPPLLSDGFAS